MFFDSVIREIAEPAVADESGFRKEDKPALVFEEVTDARTISIRVVSDFLTD